MRERGEGDSEGKGEVEEGGREGGSVREERWRREVTGEVEEGGRVGESEQRREKC